MLCTTLANTYRFRKYLPDIGIKRYLLTGCSRIKRETCFFIREFHHGASLL